MPQKPAAPNPPPLVCHCHRIPYEECEAYTSRLYRYALIRVAFVLLVVLVLIIARFAPILAHDIGLF